MQNYAAKLFLLLIVLPILAGCAEISQQTGQYTERNVPGMVSEYSEGSVIDQINSIRNGLTPQVKPNNKASSETAKNSDQPVQPPADQERKTQFENLLSVYTQAIIKTNFGDITIQFYNQDAPVTVNNFLNLAKLNFYNGTKFHRVIKDFMVQGGDPNSHDSNWADDGSGGPGYAFQDEINQHKLVKGSIAMANSGPNTNGSQFFIVTEETAPELDGKHTNFGQVIGGMDSIMKISQVAVDQNSHPQTDVNIESIELVK
jgi:cyclophilin family peptidyl-prolyl cis-trans isomerase